jgi:acetyltransferase-like isoleucine patch superfamily enzyme
MDNAYYEFLTKHKDIFHSIIFNLARPFGYLRLPTYNSTFRYAFATARAGCWQVKLGKMGKGVRIDSGFLLRGQAKNVEIGDYSYIDTNVHLEVQEPIRIGKYVHIAHDVHIQSAAEVIIGDFTAIGSGSRVYAGSNKYKSPDGREKSSLLSMSACAPPELQYTESSPVIIENFAFVGIGCVVLPGVRIGRGAIAGAGAVVTKDIPPYAIAVGIPAKVMGERPIPESEKGNIRQ